MNYTFPFLPAALGFIVTGTVSALLLASHPAHDWRALAHEYPPYHYLDELRRGIRNLRPDHPVRCLSPALGVQLKR